MILISLLIKKRICQVYMLFNGLSTIINIQIDNLITIFMFQCIKVLIKLFITTVTVIQIVYSSMDFKEFLQAPTDYSAYIINPKVGDCFQAPQCGTNCYSISFLSNQYIKNRFNDTYVKQNCMVWNGAPIQLNHQICVESETNLNIFSDYENKFYQNQVDNFNSKTIRIIAFVFQTISFLFMIIGLIQDWFGVNYCKCCLMCCSGIQSEELKTYLFFFILDCVILPFYIMTAIKYQQECISDFIIRNFSPTNYFIIGAVQIISIPSLLRTIISSKDTSKCLFGLGIFFLSLNLSINMALIVMTTIINPGWVVGVILTKMTIQLFTGLHLLYQYCKRTTIKVSQTSIRQLN